MSENNFEERSKLFSEELEKLKDKYQIEMNTKISFPVYNILPLEVELAIRILTNHRMKVEFTYNDGMKNK